LVGIARAVLRAMPVNQRQSYAARTDSRNSRTSSLSRFPKVVVLLVKQRDMKAAARRHGAHHVDGASLLAREIRLCVAFFVRYGA
jgi:hypothetical protein